MADPLPVTLRSIAAHTHQHTGKHGWLVTFVINRGSSDTDVTFPTFIGDEIPEEHIVRFARSHLAHTFERVGEERIDWKLTKEERDQYNAG